MDASLFNRDSREVLQLLDQIMKNQPQEFDFTRNDKLYEVSIPSYQHIKQSVYYEIHLIDLVKNMTYIHNFRFNELKEYNQLLQDLKLQLPEFPKTHFWKKTNKNPEMIKERKKLLQRYFNVLVNDPFTRGSQHIKRFIKICKYGDKFKRANSMRLSHFTPQNKRSKSTSKGDSTIKISIKQLKAWKR